MNQKLTALKMPNPNAVAQQVVGQGKVLKQVVQTTLQTDEKDKTPDNKPSKWWIRRNDLHRTFIDEVFEKPTPPQLLEICGPGSWIITPFKQNGEEDRSSEEIMQVGTQNKQIPNIQAGQMSNQMLPPPPPPPPSGNNDFMSMMMANKALEEEKRVKDLEERRREEDQRRRDREDEIRREKQREEARKDEENRKEEARKREAEEKEEKRKEEERQREIKRKDEEDKHRRELEIKKLEIESKRAEDERKAEEKRREEEQRREELRRAEKKEREDKEEQWRREQAAKEDQWRKEQAQRREEREEAARKADEQWRKEQAQRREEREEENRRREEAERRDRQRSDDMRRELAEKERADKAEREERRLEEERKRTEEIRRQTEIQSDNKFKMFELITNTASTLLPQLGGLIKKDPPPPQVDGNILLLEEMRRDREERREERERERDVERARNIYSNSDYGDNNDSDDDDRQSPLEETMSLLRLGMDLGKGKEEKKDDGILEKIVGALPLIAQSLGALKLNSALQQVSTAKPVAAAPQVQVRSPNVSQQKNENRSDKQYSKEEVEDIFKGTIDGVFSDPQALRAQILSNPKKYGPVLASLLNEHGAELMSAVQGAMSQTEQQEPEVQTATPKSEDENLDLDDVANG